jgi:hypothetical protein
MKMALLTQNTLMPERNSGGIGTSIKEIWPRTFGVGCQVRVFLCTDKRMHFFDDELVFNK